jgi:hypothetical protein
MSSVGTTEYFSPDWYRQRGAVYCVNLPEPLTASDVQELLQIAQSINRNFVGSMAAVLESYGIRSDVKKAGGEHIRLIKWLRNRFAHGDWNYNAHDSKHVQTRDLLIKLFPVAVGEPGFDLSIDTILEPLKNRVLSYIGEST